MLGNGRVCNSIGSGPLQMDAPGSDSRPKWMQGLYVFFGPLSSVDEARGHHHHMVDSDGVDLIDI